MAEGVLGILDGQSDIRASEGIWLLDDDDWALIAMLQDPIFCAELLFEDPRNHEYSGCYHVRDYQYPLFRPRRRYNIRPTARETGKTESIKARAVSHVFKRMGEGLHLTAPQMIHLDPLTRDVESRITATRLTRDFLKRDSQRTGFTHKPFRADFMDGTTIIGSIPHLDGKGVKGIHTPDLIMDESQDYSMKGFTEVFPTVMKDHVDATGDFDFTVTFYGVHGAGQGGTFGRLAKDPSYDLTIITRLQTPWWSKEEKDATAAMYGGTHSPDYRRNVLGEPGQAFHQFFSTARLMACFRGDTLVATMRGHKRISSVNVGDEIWGADGLDSVQGVHATRHKRVVVVRLNTGEEIVCSPEHPFLTDWGWGHADQIAGRQLYRRTEAMRALRSPTLDAPGEILRTYMCGTVAGGNAQGEAHEGQAWVYDSRMRRLRRGVQAVGCSPILFAKVHGPGFRRREASASTRVSGLRDLVSADETYDGPMQSQVPGPRECGAQRAATWYRDASYAPLRARRLTGAAIFALASPWGDGGRMVCPILYRPLRSTSGTLPLPARYSESDADGGDRSRWACAPYTHWSREGRRSRPMADGPWVENVTTYEPGSDGWGRYCGLGDSVILYDLTMRRHPSFAVGRSEVLVHNCMDDDKESHYNTVVFKAQELHAEEVDTLIGPENDVGSLLDLPDHLGQQVYGGMDIGLVSDPTVIMIWAVLPDAKKKSRLQLIRMIHLWRFTERQIRECTYRIARQYGLTLRAFGQDITGLGLPLYQAMESDEQCPDHLKEVSHGYIFNAKVPVAVDKNYASKQGDQLVDQYGHIVEIVRDKWTGQESLVARMTMIEASTRYLRGFVDDGFLLLPFHEKLISDFQGETENRVKAMGGVRKKPNAFHMLDAARTMAMAYRQGEMEEQIYAKKPQPVYDRAVYVPPN